MWPLNRKVVPDPGSALALEEAKENLKRTRSRDDQVRSIARDLRLIRERNHFTERLRPIMLKEDEGGS